MFFHNGSRSRSSKAINLISFALPSLNAFSSQPLTLRPVHYNSATVLYARLRAMATR